MLTFCRSEALDRLTSGFNSRLELFTLTFFVSYTGLQTGGTTSGRELCILLCHCALHGAASSLSTQYMTSVNGLFTTALDCSPEAAFRQKYTTSP